VKVNKVVAMTEVAIKQRQKRQQEWQRNSREA